MDNKKRLTIFVLVSIIGTIAGIFGYSNAKITTFEGCENSWLARSITFYDYAEYVPNAIEKKCTLWTGKSFEKKLAQELIIDQKRAAEIATAHLSYPVTIIEVKKMECEGCFFVTFQRGDGSQQDTKIIKNWKYESNQDKLEFGDDSEINKSCSVNSDCKLPMSYALRSNCPYEIKCSSSKCTVICPWDEKTITSFFPTQKKPATAVMQALLSNKPEELKLVNGCFRVDNGFDDYLIIWPYGFSFSTNENGIVQINNESGQSIILVGDKVKFGGGGGEMSGGDSEDVSVISAELPSNRCSGPYWIVGEIVEIIS